MLKNAVGFTFHETYKRFHLPRYFTIGLAAQRNGYTLSLDSEYIFGTFSGLEKKSVQVWFLRAGFEKELASWAAGRFGLIYPVIAKTSTLGDLREDMPWPKLGGALGLGIKFKRLRLDIGIYGDPAKSYVAQAPVVSSVVSVGFSF